MQDINSIVLFSGPGGVSTGLRWAGIDNSVGVEFEDSAVATARAAGLTVLQEDVSKCDPVSVYHDHFGKFSISRRLLLQSSPPCQGISNAGKGKGREDFDLLIGAIEALTSGQADPWGIPDLVASLWDNCSDDKSPLTFETVRWIADLDPDFVMLEQVPQALPIWEAIGRLLESWGYSVWTGNVQAERFGVPQTRKRAILLASQTGEVTEPVYTHSKYNSRNPTKLEEGVERWVSMAEALGWGEAELVGFPRLDDGRGDAIEIDGKMYRGRDLRQATNPSFVVTEKARSWKRYFPTHMGDVYNKNGCIRQANEPAPTMTASMDNGNFQWISEDAVAEKVQERINNQSGTKFDLTWPAKRPAPTVAGREIVTMPGANANRFNGSTKSRNDGVRVTVEEAGVLQSFPWDYPWQGNKTAKFQQVGNAVPPLMAARLVEHLVTCASERVESEEVA